MQYIVVIDKVSTTRGLSALFHFIPEPLIVFHRCRKQLKSDFVGGTTGLSGEAIQFLFEFARKLQFHLASLGAIWCDVN
jgi:hypothetical protein